MALEARNLHDGGGLLGPDDEPLLDPLEDDPAVSDDADAPEPAPAVADVESLPVIEPGPMDSGDADTSQGYVDLGSLLVPAIQGLQIRAEVAEDKKTVQRVLLVLGQSGLQVQVAAAPKSGGVWDEIRQQIAEGLESQGADLEQRSDRYGPELRAQVPVALPDGTKGTQPMRIIGREGPRWFARIDVMGPAALDDVQFAPLQAVLDRLVVHRGGDPRPRLDLLPLQLPSQAVEVPGE